MFVQTMLLIMLVCASHCSALGAKINFTITPDGNF